MSELRERLLEELKDPEYRYAYAEDFLNTSVATQIRTLREQRGMTQADLAYKIGTKQAGVSRLENVNYSAWKTETLRKIAKAVDARLKITFETFGTLIDEAEQFSRAFLQRPKFEDDPIFFPEKAVAEAVTFPQTAALSLSENYYYQDESLLAYTLELILKGEGAYKWKVLEPSTPLRGAVTGRVYLPGHVVETQPSEQPEGRWA